MIQWYKIKDSKELISPSLLVYPDRIEKNIDMMIKTAGGTNILRPHIKTHKMAEIVKLQIRKGIFKFKCATIAEAELLAKCQAKDILLAMQPVAIDMIRLLKLIEEYPDVDFSTLTDSLDTVLKFSNLAQEKKIKIALWMDINNGMNRTGIIPNTNAVELYSAMVSDPNIIAKGLHVYDGHIKNSELQERAVNCNKDFESVMSLKKTLENKGIDIPTIIAGGTPTFPIHKNRENTEVCPGTTLLWDAGYARRYVDLPFLPAAVLFTRVVSKPNKNLVCFDLGHKSVASEMSLPRVKFLELNNSRQISQSEEHLVVDSLDNRMNIGDESYALPIHICPTVSKYKKVITIVNNKITGSWEIAARDQQIII